MLNLIYKLQSYVDKEKQINLNKEPAEFFLQWLSAFYRLRELLHLNAFKLENSTDKVKMAGQLVITLNCSYSPFQLS